MPLTVPPLSPRHCAAALALVLCACGGGGAGNSSGTPSLLPSLQLSSTSNVTLTGGACITMTGNRPVTNWALATGAPGTLTPGGGSTATYCPPAGDSAGADRNVAISASAGQETQSLILTVLPPAGTYPLASLASANSMAADKRGNIYISNGSEIVKVDGTGMATPLVSLNRTLFAPFSDNNLAADPEGNLYLTDTYRTIRRIAKDGTITLWAGDGVASSLPDTHIVDGSGERAGFYSAGALSLDDNGNLYVADGRLYIRKVNPARTVSTLVGRSSVLGLSDGLTLSPNGTADGDAMTAAFRHIDALAADRAGNVYIADTFAVRRMAPDGSVTTLAGSLLESGYRDGKGVDALFERIGGISIGADGDLYIADIGNRKIRRMKPDGTVSTVVTFPPGRNEFDTGGQPVAVLALSKNVLMVLTDTGLRKVIVP
jgi:streptogramin lyase